MLVLEGGTIRETMDDLGHTSLTVAVNSYQLCRQGAPPRNRGAARLPLPAVGRSGSDPHRHRPEGASDRQAPGRGGKA